MLLSTLYLALLTFSLAWDFIRHGRIAKRSPAGAGRYDPGPTAAGARFTATAPQSSYQRWSWGPGGRIAAAYQPATVALFVVLDLSRLAHEPSAQAPSLIGQAALRLDDGFGHNAHEDVWLASGLAFEPSPHELVLAQVAPMDHEAAVVWSALHEAGHAAPLAHDGWIV